MLEVHDNVIGCIEFYASAQELAQQHKQWLAQEGELTEEQQITLDELERGTVNNYALYNVLGIVVKNENATP